MQCSEILDLIEPIAAGDLSPDEQTRSHLQTCPRCAGMLASARRVDALLNGMEMPPAPPAFATGVLQRIRRDKWRSEQKVDLLFNVSIAAAVVLIAASIAALLNVDTVLAVSGSVWTLLKEGSRQTVRTAAPTVATYMAALGLLGSALVMWWWAERRLQF